MSGSCGWFPLSHAEIDAWVERHRDELPASLEELSRLPVPIRKAIVNAVSPERRIGYWREHLTTFLAQNAELTTEQRALANDIIAQLPDIFGVPLEEGRERIRSLEVRMRALLTREQAYLMFGIVGPPEPPEGLPLPPDAVPSPR